MMTMLDFDFVSRQDKLAGVRLTNKVVRSDCGKQRSAPVSAVQTFPLTVNEGEQFLRIVAQTSRIKRHFDLFQLLQSHELQHFIPHHALISAWGNFSEPNLQIDVVSAIPGVRTNLLSSCNIDGMLKDFYRRWLANGRQPLLVDSTMGINMAESVCGCALHASLQRGWSLLVHGVTDVRDGSDSLYLAFNEAPMLKGRSAERFCRLADSLVTQIDVGFRKIAALKMPVSPLSRESSPGLRKLSAREEQILQWVSEGKTNAEIAEIVGISAFTVKNHAQRIFRKLEVTNRIEAIAKHRQLNGQA